MLYVRNSNQGYASAWSGSPSLQFRKDHLGRKPDTSICGNTLQKPKLDLLIKL